VVRVVRGGAWWGWHCWRQFVDLTANVSHLNALLLNMPQQMETRIYQQQQQGSIGKFLQSRIKASV